MISFKKVDWPAPLNISAVTTTRKKGFSKPPYDNGNFALHVGDNPLDVMNNRKQLKEELNLTYDPFWLNQTHSNNCIIVDNSYQNNADAAISRSMKYPLVIMTADCVPILLCNLDGTEIAAIHAGWKGLAHGIIENTLNLLLSPKNRIIAWIGPAICGKCYEVDRNIVEYFMESYSFCSSEFILNTNNKYFANLPGIVETILRKNHINTVIQSQLCTFHLKSEYFSYRRSSKTGRIASLIWFNKFTRDNCHV